LCYPSDALLAQYMPWPCECPSFRLFICQKLVLYNKKLSYYHRGTARRTVLVNLCYVSLGKRARKVSNSISNLQHHLRASVIVSAIMFHCNYASILHRCYHLFLTTVMTPPLEVVRYPWARNA